MQLWLRVRRVRTCVLVMFALVGVLILAGDVALPVPNLLGGPHLALPLALLAPIAMSIALAFGFTTRDPLLEAVASRPLPMMDTLYALLVAASATILCLLVGLLGASQYAFAAGRNTLGYVGMTLIGRRVVGSHNAALVPVVFIFVVSLFGSGPGHQAFWWAWPLARVDDGLAGLLVAALLALGCGLTLRRPKVGAAEQGD